MSDTVITWLLVAAAGLAAVCVCALPVLFHYAVPKDMVSSATIFRDRAPALFRVCRWGIIRFAKYLDMRMSSRQREYLNLRLNEAGLSYAIMPAEILVVRWAMTLAVFLPGVYLILANSLFSINVLFPFLLLLPIAHFYVDLWLRDQCKRRKHKIERDFPFFLDIVVLSMKAGLAFPAAIQQATSQLPDGPIRQEMSRLIRETRTGISRRESLQRLASRIRLASVSNFVAAVSQADETGGSLTKALNEQAKQRRRERFQRAEKLANQAPVKLLFPLVAFLFPVTFIIIGYPLYEQLKESGLLG